MSSNDTWRLLKGSEFRRLFVARLISNLGNGMGPIALAFAVLDTKHGSAEVLGLVLTSASVGVLLFLPFAGVFADRHRRPVIIATTDFILGLLLLIEAFLFWKSQPSLLVLATINFAAGVLMALWYPAFPGMTLLVVPKDDLQQANALISVSSNIGMITGAGFAGVLISIFGGYFALAIDALTFIVAAILVWGLRHTQERAEPTGESMMKELRSGWRVFISFRWVVVCVAAFSLVVMVLRGVEGVLGPVLMKQDFNGAKSWALVMTFEAIGLMGGGIFATRYKPRHPLLFCTLMTLSAAFFVLTLRPMTPLVLISAAAFAWGFALEGWYVHWTTALQLHIPRDSLSRVSSYDALGSLMFGPIGLALAGPALAGFGMATTTLIGSLVIVGVVGVMVLEPEVRHLTNTK